jgi:hypothetical protein
LVIFRSPLFDVEASILQFWRDYADRVPAGQHRPETPASVFAFGDSKERFAYDKGEGDRSLAYWREAHQNYFGRQRFKDRTFHEQMPLVCERFRLVYRAGL